MIAAYAYIFHNYIAATISSYCYLIFSQSYKKDRKSLVLFIRFSLYFFENGIRGVRGIRQIKK